MMKPEQHPIADETREPVVPRQGVSLLNAMLGLECSEHYVSTNALKKKARFISLRFMPPAQKLAKARKAKRMFKIRQETAHHGAE